MIYDDSLLIFHIIHNSEDNISLLSVVIIKYLMSGTVMDLTSKDQVVHPASGEAIVIKQLRLGTVTEGIV